MDGLNVWLAILGGTVTLGLIGVLVASHVGRWRWGKQVSTESAGAGAYREGEVHREQPRGTPSSVRLAAIAAVTWGAITLLVFVPAGGMLAIVSGERGTAGVLGLFSFVAALSGVALAIALMVNAFRLVRRDEGVADAGLGTARFCFIHHAVVFGGFSIAGASFHDTAFTMMALAVPCGIGMLVGAQLRSASIEVREIDRLERDRVGDGPEADPLAAS